MKTIEYPIKEILSFEMDVNKIWWLRYNEKHECFPQMKLKSKSLRFNKKGYRDLIEQTNQYCEEHDLMLETDHIWKMRSGVPQFGSCGLFLPHLLFPMDSGGFVNGWIGTSPFKPYPYYQNALYKKYIDDNNGECPLPLPETNIYWIMSDTIPHLECKKYDRIWGRGIIGEQNEIE